VVLSRGVLRLSPSRNVANLFGMNIQRVKIVARELARHGHCQTNLTGPAKGADLKRSSCKLTPFREFGSAVLFEDVAGVEVTVEVEVVVD